MSKTEIITFGCRLNAYESEVMRANCEAAGLDHTVIVNTCAVTGEAVRQARQAIRRARLRHPDARVVVTGCAAQVDPNQFAELDEVDNVIGNDVKLRSETFAALATEKLERVVVNDIMAVRETAGHLIDGFGLRTRAYVQIQNGCDHRCTFCIIPYGRGNSRSVPAGQVVAQIRRLVEKGYREVVLTGVDITSYGGDLPGQLTLGKLVRKVLDMVPKLERLRLSSIDSIEVDEPLKLAIESDSRLMPHLHLSLQAGDDLTLKRMKRRHLRDDALRFCEEMRRARPDVVFGADLIAGFPTETADMFRRTMDLVDECELTYLHVFPFSPRNGTPAARMPQVPRSVVKERAAVLRAKGQELLTKHLKAQRGCTVEVLLERPHRGRTPQFTEMVLSELGESGDLVVAKVSGHDGAHLIGEVVA